MLVEVGEGCPNKLFVSGLHGDEHVTTKPFLKALIKEIDEKSVEGKVSFRNISSKNSSYISTLEKDFYETDKGEKLLNTIKTIDPSIYLEIHSYSRGSYGKLTDKKRLQKKGVPPLVDLGSGLLAGSISPLLRKRFSKGDFCFLLDIPKGRKPWNEPLVVMKMVVEKKSRKKITKNLKEKYPAKTETMINNYKKFYGIKN